MVYDILLKLDEEVDFIWWSRWSVPKVLYFLARYYGVVYTVAVFTVNALTDLPVELCSKWWWFNNAAGDIFFTTVINIILVYRLHAMYRSRKVFFLFIGCVVMEFGFELWATIRITILDYQNTVPPPTLSFGIPWPGCVSDLPEDINETTLMSWVPCSVVGVIFFLMTVRKLFVDRHYPSDAWTAKRQYSPLVVSFIQDGALSFFLTFAIMISDMFVLLFVRGPVQGVLTPWLIAVYSFAGSRLILNLREAARRGNMTLDQSMNTYHAHNAEDSIVFASAEGATDGVDASPNTILEDELEMIVRRGATSN